MNIDPAIDMPARGGMLTGEMLHKAYWAHVEGVEHHTWSRLGDRLKAHYTAMAEYLNTALIDNGAVERDALRSQIAQLNAQITALTETVLCVENERDAFQQIALALGTQPPTATMLLEQERADYHARMREMGIPFQESDHA